MEIKELFIKANETEQSIIEQIAGHQWELLMPEKVTRRPMTIMEVVRYHTWDSAWIPDGLAGKTIEEVGDTHDHLLKVRQEDLKSSFALYNQRAITAVRALENLDTIVHLTYGDFPARQFLQHNIGVRTFWAYDIARLIGVDFTLADDFVEALIEEFSPVVETYRQYGMFPPEVKAAADASPQTKLLAMVGRD
jgi:hypothetical protein